MDVAGDALRPRRARLREPSAALRLLLDRLKAGLDRRLERLQLAAHGVDALVQKRDLVRRVLGVGGVPGARLQSVCHRHELLQLRDVLEVVPARGLTRAVLLVLRARARQPIHVREQREQTELAQSGDRVRRGGGVRRVGVARR